jgi:hypothetical protein
MNLPGLKRVKRVYPLWFIFGLFIVFIMVALKIKIPEFLFILTLIFILKDLIFDSGFITPYWKKVYWAEHAPIVFLFFIIGLAAFLGANFLNGYINIFTMILSLISFMIDFYIDLITPSVVYGEKYKDL